jgi:hypothetical protein
MLAIWVIMSFVWAGVAASMATSRQRNAFGWGVGGAVFGLIAVGLLAALGKREPSLLDRGY